jgi:hypothetical protein
MTYAQGSKIFYYDFTVLMGTVAGPGPNKLNTVWSAGFNDSGYGQTAIPLPGSETQITATQWATAINALNNSYYHQTGVSSGISAPTAGIPISWFSELTTKISTAYSNRLLYNSSGSSGSGAGYSFNMVADATTGITGTGSRTLTWSSGDAARYFFNAGGRVGIRVDSVTNNNGTSRSGSIVTLGSNFDSKTLYARTATARTGTGGHIIFDTTSTGYYDLPSGLGTAIMTQIDSTSYYTSDYMVCMARTNGVQGSLNDNGNELTLALSFNSSVPGGFQFDDTLNATVNYNVFWTYPEATYLLDSWGTITVT